MPNIKNLPSCAADWAPPLPPLTVEMISSEFRGPHGLPQDTCVSVQSVDFNHACYVTVACVASGQVW